MVELEIVIFETREQHKNNRNKHAKTILPQIISQKAQSPNMVKWRGHQHKLCVKKLKKQKLFRQKILKFRKTFFTTKSKTNRQQNLQSVKTPIIN